MIAQTRWYQLTWIHAAAIQTSYLQLLNFKWGFSYTEPKHTTSQHFDLRTDGHNDNNYLLKAYFVRICLFDMGLTSLNLFQSYCDGVWMWQGAQCSLLECCLTEISSPRHFEMIFQAQSHYTDTELISSSSTFLMLSVKRERAANTIFEVFGMTRPGIDPATFRSQSGRSTTSYV